MRRTHAGWRSSATAEPRSRAILVAGTGVLVGLVGGIDEAEQLFEEATAIAREVGDERVLGRVYWSRSVSYWFNGRNPEAIATGREAIDRLRRANDQWGLVDALCWTAFPMLFGGDHREARVLFEESIELGRRVGQHGGETLGLRGAAVCEAFRGADLDVLERGARVDLERFEGSDSPWAGQSHAWLAAVHLLPRRPRRCPSRRGAGGRAGARSRRSPGSAGASGSSASPTPGTRTPADAFSTRNAGTSQSRASAPPPVARSSCLPRPTGARWPGSGTRRRRSIPSSPSASTSSSSAPSSTSCSHSASRA